MALEARDVISIGGWLDMGTPPTPIPMFAWIGIFAISQQAFIKVIARARFHGQDRLVLIFTTGPNIFFKQGEYNPGSSGGRELIAHELTHVVQQGAGKSTATSTQGGEKDE